jgi:ABC-type transport system involved in multi-copper enzyme maturation permease subunit
MASTTVPPAGPPARGKAGLPGALASEWTKIRTVRSTYWTLIALVIVAIGLGAAITAGVASDFNSHPGGHSNFDATQVSLGAFMELGPLVIAVLGAMAITAEYSTGMIRTSLTVQPRRGTVYAAKIIVFAIVALVVSLVISVVAFFLGQALLSSTGLSATLSHPYTLRAIIGGAVYVAVAGLLAFGIGAILRHTAGSITIAIAVLFIVPILINLLPSDWQADIVRWLPSSSWQVLTTTVGPQSGANLWPAWGQFAVTAGYAVVLLIVGAILFNRRDA